MRKLLLAASAIALLSGSAAFAQTVSVSTLDLQQTNNAPQVAVGIDLGSYIKGTATLGADAVGNLIQLDTTADSASITNGGFPISQINNADQTALSAVVSSKIGGNLDQSAKAFGNSISLDAGNGSIGVFTGSYSQLNNGTDLAVATTGPLFGKNTIGGTATLTAVAVGNDISFSAVGTNQSSGFNQTDNAPQVALAISGDTKIGAQLTLASTSVGNSQSYVTGPGGDFAPGSQTNNGLQVAAAVSIDDKVGGSESLTASAFGNSLFASGTDLTVNYGAGQLNNAPQLAVAVSLDDSVKGNSTISSTAVGNIFSGTGNFQGNNPTQSFAQLNNAPQVALAGSVGGSFGSLNISSTAIGNAVSLSH
jgi:hypothetical protein